MPQRGSSRKINSIYINKLASLGRNVDNIKLIDSVIFKNSKMLLRHFSIHPFKEVSNSLLAFFYNRCIIRDVYKKNESQGNAGYHLLERLFLI